jgi:hypothetical protein
MDYTHEEIKWAVTGVSLLPIIALVAIASFTVRSRLALLLGAAGALLGLIIPQPVVYVQWSDPVAAYMSIFTDLADHLLFWGIVGAAAGWGIGFYLASRVRRPRLPAK